jgi:hypothetical protein
LNYATVAPWSPFGAMLLTGVSGRVGSKHSQSHTKQVMSAVEMKLAEEFALMTRRDRSPAFPRATFRQHSIAVPRQIGRH